MTEIDQLKEMFFWLNSYNYNFTNFYCLLKIVLRLSKSDIFTYLLILWDSML